LCQHFAGKDGLLQEAAAESAGAAVVEQVTA
jgi:hypothetical protein